MVAGVRWIKGISVKTKMLPFLGENIGHYCFGVGTGYTTVRKYFILTKLENITV